MANKHGSTLYVKDSDGNTVRVKTTSHSKINRTATASAGAIHPGDTVIVQGTKSSSGTITATQINATSSTARAASPACSAAAAASGEPARVAAARAAEPRARHRRAPGG